MWPETFEHICVNKAIILIPFVNATPKDFLFSPLTLNECVCL